jgi:hypothetical protein
VRRAAAEARVLDKTDGLDGLTSLQQVFVSLLFSGLNDSEAYRRSYDVTGMTDNAVRIAAHETRHHPHVSLKLRELQDKRDSQSTLAASLTREWITKGMMDLAIGSDKDSVRLGAYTQLGKVVGIDLFRETTRVERIERTPADIDRELEEQLKSMAKTIEGRVNDTVAQKPSSARRGRKP